MNDEDFLKRWSRRKRAAETAPESSASLPVSREEAMRSAADSDAKSDGEFDLSTLPPLDSITKTTDVTAFLRKGIPPALTREALRRAWLADPAIRDFVGLAENAWDFNNPDAMPGFGSLEYTPEQVRDLVARIVGGARTSDEADSTARPQQDSVMTANAEETPFTEPLSCESATDSKFDVESAENAAAPTEIGSPVPESSSPADHDSKPDVFSVERRMHGSALPR
jgi:hypothetical protein